MTIRQLVVEAIHTVAILEAISSDHGYASGEELSGSETDREFENDYTEARDTALDTRYAIIDMLKTMKPTEVEIEAGVMLFSRSTGIDTLKHWLTTSLNK